MENKLLVAYRRNPFTPGHVDLEIPEGITVSEILKLANIAPSENLFVFINDMLVERGLWDTSRPIKNSTVTIGISPTGSSGNTGKNTTRTVAMIAVMMIAIVATYGTAAYLGPALSLSVAQASIAGAMVGMGVGIAGSMLVNALIPLPTQKPSDNKAPNYLSRMSNSMDLYGPVPRIFGKHRVFPRYAAMPYTELVGSKKNYLRCLFCVGKGRYELSDFKIGDVNIDDYNNVEMDIYYTSDGLNFPLFPNDVSEQQLSIELIENETNMRTTAIDVEEISLEITFPSGLYKIDGDGNRSPETVNLTIEYSLANQNNWVSATSFRRLHFSGTPSENIQSGQTITTATGAGVVRYVHYANKMSTIAYINDNGETKYETLRYVDYVHISITSGSFTSSQTATINSTYTAVIDAVSLFNFNIEDKRSSGFREGFSFWVPKGQYDVRIRKTSGDADSQRIRTVFWTALRGLTRQTPVNLIDCTLIAVRIMASGQLNGILDQFNCMSEAIVESWDGTEWIETKSRNPAWAFVETLCGNSNKRPLAKSRLDLAALLAFRDNCETKGFNFDAVVDYRTTVWELLRQICAAGRATPGRTDNKYTVIEDKTHTLPVQHFSPRNSWGYSGSRVFPDMPHALRIRFPNENKKYEMDECVVYDDGYNSGNATLYENIEFFGVTNYNHCWKLGRYHLAVIRLRPETHVFNVDVEHVVCTRGDMVYMTHDVLMVGLGQGRIKSISTTSISIDDVLTMETAKTYGFQFRRADGTFKTCTITTNVGEHAAGTTFTINPAMAAGDVPVIGDLAFWGETGSISIPILVSRIDPGPDLTARLTCIPYNSAILTADSGTIPPWDSNITIPPAVDRRPPAPSIISATFGYDQEVINQDGTVAIFMHVGFSFQSSWYSVAGVEETSAGFIVETQENAGEWNTLMALGRDDRSFRFQVKNGATYGIRIKSFSSINGMSDWGSTTGIVVSFSATVPGNVASLACVGGGVNFTTRDLEISWTAVLGGGSLGATTLDYKVEVRTSDGNTLLRTEYVTQPLYLYDFDKNTVDGGPRASVQIRVWVRNRFEILSTSYASAVFTNQAPSAPASLTTSSPMGSVQFFWAANTERDFSHFSYRTQVETAGWSAWQSVNATSIGRVLTDAESTTHGSDATIYIEVKAVDAFGQESTASSANANAGSLNIPPTEIDDFAVTASKLFIRIPVIQGLTITNDSPVAGRCAWSACTLVFNGVAYSIAAGSTPAALTSGQKYYIYWKDLASTFTAVLNTHPSEISGWLPGEDFIIAVHLQGQAPQQAWNALANQVIGSAYIMSAAIQDAHIANLSGSKILASSSVAIGPVSTYASDGIQLEYNSGNPRFYAGNGAGKHIKFDGTDVEIAGKVSIVAGSSGYSNLNDVPTTLGSISANELAALNLTYDTALENPIGNLSTDPQFSKTSSTSDVRYLSQNAASSWGEWQSTGGRQSSACYKITPAGTARSVIFRANSATRYISAENGNRFYYRFWYFCSSTFTATSGHVRVQVISTDRTKANPTNPSETLFTPTLNAWTMAEGWLVVNDADAQYGYIQIYIGGSAAGYVLIDDIFVGTHKPGADITSESTSSDTAAVGGTAAATIAAVSSNFNGRNDRIATAPLDPTTLGSGNCIDHVTNTDGSADISFEWAWAGSESAIDGFQVFIYSATGNSAYTFGTTPAQETVYTTTPEKRAFILNGVPANRYYTFGIRAFRVVDADINSSGLLISSIVKSTYAGENPYQPSATVAFAGNITGTIDGTAVATVSGAITNFNNRNDRIATTPTAPTVAIDGSCIDHVTNTDGSVDISFEWIWGGTAADNDGFQIYVYASTSNSAYTFGTTPAEETVYVAPIDKRAFILRGVPQNKYYTFGVRCFRVVDSDINAAGIVMSAIVKSATAGENPYQPGSTVAFAGDITGTINGRNSIDLTNYLPSRDVGANLVFNPGFEEKTVSGNTNPDFWQTTGVQLTGGNGSNFGIRVTRSGTNVNCGQRVFAGSAYIYVECLPGEVYEYGGDAKVSGSTATINIYEYDKDRSYIRIASTLTSTSATWETKTTSFIVGSTARYLLFILRNLNTDGTADFDNVFLRKRQISGASDLDTTIISGGKIITGLLTADNIQAGTLSVDRLGAGTITATKIVTGSLTYTQIGDAQISNYNSSSSTGANVDSAITRVGSDRILIILRGIGKAGSWYSGTEGAGGICTPSYISLRLRRTNSSGTVLANFSTTSYCADIELLGVYMDVPGGTGSQTYWCGWTVGSYTNLKMLLVNFQR